MEKFEFISFVDPVTLACAAAGEWLDEVRRASQRGERHSVALSGGRIARWFFEAAGELARVRDVSFEGVHFFWSDERCVPPTDDQSNFALAEKYLLRGISAPAGNTHRIRGEKEPTVAAKEAEKELRQWVLSNEKKQPELDIVFLGLGEDGHVASLFPGEPEEIKLSDAVYRPVIGPKPPPNRVTMGYPAIASAKQVWVLASGEGKKETLRESLSPKGQTPLARVIQMRLRTKIFSDLE